MSPKGISRYLTRVFHFCFFVFPRSSFLFFLCKGSWEVLLHLSIDSMHFLSHHVTRRLNTRRYKVQKSWKRLSKDGPSQVLQQALMTRLSGYRGWAHWIAFDPPTPCFCMPNAHNYSFSELSDTVPTGVCNSVIFCELAARLVHHKQLKQGCRLCFVLRCLNVSHVFLLRAGDSSKTDAMHCTMAAAPHKSSCYFYRNSDAVELAEVRLVTDVPRNCLLLISAQPAQVQPQAVA